MCFWLFNSWNCYRFCHRHCHFLRFLSSRTLILIIILIIRVVSRYCFLSLVVKFFFSNGASVVWGGCCICSGRSFFIKANFRWRIFARRSPSLPRNRRFFCNTILTSYKRFEKRKSPCVMLFFNSQHSNVVRYEFSKRFIE